MCIHLGYNTLTINMLLYTCIMRMNYDIYYCVHELVVCVCVCVRFGGGAIEK